MSHTAYFYADLEKPCVTAASARPQLLLSGDIHGNKTSGVIQMLRANRQNFSSFTDLTSDEAGMMRQCTSHDTTFTGKNYYQSENCLQRNHNGPKFFPLQAGSV
jgi:hypothetical protein